MANPPQTLSWLVLSLPKAGHESAEFEDAFAGDPAAGRFAIADGASESSFARAWAELLTESYVRDSSFQVSQLREARKTWNDTFKDHPFSWHTEEKFADGAFAAFLGVTFAADRGHWQAVAVGDCCLFQVRQRGLLHAFPMTAADAFGNQPGLIGSRQSATVSAGAAAEGDWQDGDHLFLMTDALAQWFLRSTEAAEQPWDAILALTEKAVFEEWISGIRESAALRNDDVTLMVISGGRGTEHA